VLTSQREGFPNVLLEAMAASLPVIATPAGETPELVSEGKTGFIIPFDDVQALAERMVILAQSPDLRGRMGAAGRQRVEQQYGFARLGENMMRVYQDVARQRSDRSTLHLIETILQAFEHSEPSPLYSTPQN
jgi:glycosyltransferase involved in cell wall biosynthesis